MIIGTRGSRLALAQAHIIASMLESRFNNLKFELSIIRTSGDKNQNSEMESLTIFGKGIFVREIDQIVLEDKVDLAVHSMKDIPTQHSSKLALAAIPSRASPWDVLVSPFGSLAEIPEKARLGTSSVRRKAELLRLRPDLEIIPLRGNIDTRLRKIASLDGIIIAEAALQRIHFPEVDKYNINRFSQSEMLPSPGQGALGVVTKTDAADVMKLLKEIDHFETRQQVTAERSFLSELGGGCAVPIGALANVYGKELTLHAAITSSDGSQSLRTSMSGNVTEPKKLGMVLARELKKRGAEELMINI